MKIGTTVIIRSDGKIIVGNDPFVYLLFSLIHVLPRGALSIMFQRIGIFYYSNLLAFWSVFIGYGL